MAVSTYRLSPAHVLRLAGTIVIGLGVLWVAGTLLSVSGPVRVFLACLTLVVLVGIVVAAARPPRILTMDESGYRVRWVRGAGTSAATWREVEEVISQRVGTGRFMVFDLRGGAQTAVPLTLLGTRHLAAQREVHDRMNAAHGYRRLDQP